MQGSATYKPAIQQNQDQLILENLDYVSKILSTMTVGVEDPDSRDNLHSAGVLGLVEAANSFERSRGIPFRTYAYPRIRGAIVDELRKLSPVSQHVLKNIGRIKKAYEVLEPPVTPEALALEAKLSYEQVLDALEAMRFIKPEDWNDLSDVVHASWQRQSREENSTELAETKEVLAEAIEKLPRNERLTLTLYYHDELNLSEIGAVLDLSESRVSRILAAAKFRLQEQIKCKLN